MAFLAPVTLFGLLLVSLPLVIHLLVRRRGRRLDFPSLRYLRETPSFKLYPRRLRQPLLLALRASAIILIVLGMARPLFTFRSRTPETVRFILLDASLSMRARGRAEAAREQARALVNKLRSGERASVISLGPQANQLTELTEDRDKLLEAIGHYKPSGGAVDYDAGLAAISKQLQREPHALAEADIISDFQESGLEGFSSVNTRARPFVRVNPYPVGASFERNAFLVDESLRKTERGIELSASEIISEPDGRRARRQAWSIEERDTTTDRLQWHTEINNQITGRIEILEADDFDADDARFFAFTPPGENRVLLIEDGTDGTLYLRAALEAVTGEDAAAQSVLDTRPRLPERAADLAPYSLIILTLHGKALESERDVLAEYAGAGGTVWMFLGRDLDTESWNRLASEPAEAALPFQSVARQKSREALRFGAMDTQSPELSGLDESAFAALGAVRLSESYEVTPRASADTLIRLSNSAPAFISARVGRGKALLMATSLERASGDLGHSTAFPALMATVLRAAATSSREPLSQTIGEAVRLGVAPDVDVRLIDWKGNVRGAKARDFIQRPLDYFSEPGIYHLEFAGQQKFLAFNAPALESERALAAPDKLKSYFRTGEEGKAAALDAERERASLEQNSSLWRYFLCAAFLLIIAELFVAMRQHKVVEG